MSEHKIDVVMITNGKRPELFKQTGESLYDNCDDATYFNLVVVHDGGKSNTDYGNANIVITDPVGASACRNIGASSIPKYRRGQYVMFIDDDVYMCPGWDEKLIDAYERTNGPAVRSIISGHAHPYNHTVLATLRGFNDHQNLVQTTVLSTVHIFMDWKVWDGIGYWIEPGGPAGSEDVDYCKRAQSLGIGLVVTDPHCVIHTGLTSSRGHPIVGHDLMVEQNVKLTKLYHVAVLNK